MRTFPMSKSTHGCFVEVRDHPLFLIPLAARKELLGAHVQGGRRRRHAAPSWMLRGTLSHKSQQVFEALLTSYGGSLDEVLRHVQVERYFISRAATAWARSRSAPSSRSTRASAKVTADRSFWARCPPRCSR